MEGEPPARGRVGFYSPHARVRSEVCPFEYSINFSSYNF